MIASQNRDTDYRPSDSGRRSLRILYYSTVGFGRIGGPVVHTISIADGLGGLGHRVLLVCRKPRIAVRGRFRVLPLPKMPFYIGRWGLGARLRLALVRLLIRAWRPDCVYHRSSYEMLAVKAADSYNVPRICEIHHLRPPGQQVPYRSGKTPAEDIDVLAAHAGRAAGVVVIDEVDGRQVMDTLGVPAEHVLRRPHGFNPTLFYRRDRAATRKQLGHETDAFIIGYSGSYARYDDMHCLLEAAARAHRTIPKLRVLCLGAAVTSRTDPVRTAAEVGLPDDVLILQGRVPHGEVGLYVSCCDVAAIVLKETRLECKEGCETTRLPEYWGSGVCVVATDIEGSSTYQHHEASRMCAVSPEDPTALARAFIELYRNPERRERIALAGHDYAHANRTWRIAAERTSDLIERSI